MPFETFLDRLKVNATFNGHMNKFVRAVSSTVIHEFKNNLAHLFSLRSCSASLNICSGRLKVKITLECSMKKWSYIELARA